jgi:hypothetical protein
MVQTRFGILWTVIVVASNEKWYWAELPLMLRGKNEHKTEIELVD